MIDESYDKRKVLMFLHSQLSEWVAYMKGSINKVKLPEALPDLVSVCNSDLEVSLEPLFSDFNMMANYGFIGPRNRLQRRSVCKESRERVSNTAEKVGSDVRTYVASTCKI